MIARRLIGWLAVAALPVAAAGCGTTTKPAARTTTTAATISVPAAASGTLTIYASVELTGPDASPWLSDAMQLALEQAGGRVDKVPVRLVVLDESPSGESSSDVVSAIAATAAADPSTIAFIGDQTSGDTATTLPILNRAGILEVSPTATYGGLTRSSTDRAEPAKYYPTGRRTFARVVPSDSAQAAAQVAYVRSAGCTRVYVLDDKSLYGRGLAATFVGDAKRSGVTVAGTRGISTDATRYGSLATGVASAADCMLFAGAPTKGVVALWGALHAANASLKLFGTDALASETFAASLGSSQSQTYLTGPTLDPSYYGDSGQAFYESYETRFGGPPDSSAIFGYEAMSAVLHAIDVASSRRRAAVVDAFFDIDDRSSPLGVYSIDVTGDTTLNRYGGYRVSGGGLQFDTVLPTTVGAT
jgi:branched-chain amino acid transport system substrate-binding protein